MPTAYLILHDQLDIQLLQYLPIDSKTDIVLMAEAESDINVVKQHKKKLVFILSSMRHFAEEIKK